MLGCAGESGKRLGSDCSATQSLQLGVTSREYFLHPVYDLLQRFHEEEKTVVSKARSTNLGRKATYGQGN